jgi:PKD repeat protein
MEYASDAYWGDPQRYQFKASIDSFGFQTELAQEDERIVRSTFTLKINGYIIPEILQKDVTALKKFSNITKTTFTLEDEPTTPITEAPLPPVPVICAPVTVLNSDSTYNSSVNSGGTLILPNQTININNTGSGLIPSVGTINVTTNAVPTSFTITGRTIDIVFPSGSTPMNVDFNADKLTALQGENITFTDLSDQTPTHWSWMFSDGTTSIVQNPVKSFLTLGFKNVTLLAGKVGAGGVNIKNSYIEILSGLLLDLFPNAAAAYSLRKLRSAYTGSAIRVRRSSDNTEQDIGFNGSNELDTTALLSFVGAGNGFVVTWYDQSGNGLNATQSTAGNQPQIVNSGIVITDNGKPSCLFNGSSQFMTTSNYNFAATDKIYTAIVANSETNNTTRLTLAFNDNSTYRSFSANYFQGTGRFAAQFSTNNTDAQTNSYNTYNVNQQYIIETLFYTNNVNVADRINIYANNSILTFNTNTNSLQGNIIANNKPLSIGADGAGNFRMQGKIQEIVLYSADQTANRSLINLNINTYYNVF